MHPRSRAFLLASTLTVASCISSHPSEVIHSNISPRRPSTLTTLPLRSPPPVAPIAAQPLRASRIALLLPLHGEWTGVSSTIREGVLDARADLNPGTEVRTYDTGADDASLLAAYHQAVDDGAAMIIGPLRMRSVSALATRVRPTIPVIALNVGDRAPVPNLYYLAPSPEDDARSAADAAYERGARRMIALTQDDGASSRIMAAFADRLEALGGRLVAQKRLGLDAGDDRGSVQELMAAFNLHPLDAEGPPPFPSSMPGASGKTFDATFLVADAPRTRSLIAEIRRFRGPEVPIYGLSSSESVGMGDIAQDGVFICDMPSVMDALSGLHPPAQGAISLRLRALGADAYAVGVAATSSRLDPGVVIAGDTGTLTLDADGVLARSVECASPETARIPM